MLQTYYGDFDEIFWSLCMYEAAVSAGGSELEVDVTRVAHVVAWQVDACLCLTEGYHVVEHICTNEHCVRSTVLAAKLKKYVWCYAARICIVLF